MNILTVENLSKIYGKFHAVRGISFSVKEGEIFALIGPNGAGKSTSLRIISTILSATSGTVTVNGFDLANEPQKIRECISYLPEESGAYKNLTGIDYLNFMAELFSENDTKKNEYIASAKEICGLGDRLKEKVKNFSKGMTRKLLLARALMTKPKLAILDEPTSGLDVLNAIEIRNTIRNFSKQGVSVLLSSHNMLEIEFLSDRVAIIDGGLIHETGTCAELKAKYNANNLEEVFAGIVAKRGEKEAA